MSLTLPSTAFSGWIGAGREDITPPVGIFARSWGAAVHEAAEGIHRPLTATALSLRPTPDAPPCLLVVLDLGWWRTAEDERFVRDAVLAGLNLDPARLLISLTHTHAGPSICREDADKPGGPLILPYLEQVRNAVLRSGEQALRSAQPAVLEWDEGVCNLARNRDLPEPDAEEASEEGFAFNTPHRTVEEGEALKGKAASRYLCGYNPSGPADPTLLIGRVTTADGTLLATLVNYACHPTTLAWENRQISPDFVGAMREVLEEATGGAPCLFLQGASGELAPRDQYTADTTLADRHGRQLGFAALAALTGMTPPLTRPTYTGAVESGAPLAVWRMASSEPSTGLECRRMDVEVPVRAGLSLAEVEARLATETDPVQIERLRRRRRITRHIGEGATTSVPLWIWRLGDSFLVAQPDEAYSWLQVELRNRFPNRRIAVLNITNGPYCGYLPPAPLYGRDLYPVWQTPFDRGCLERVLDAAASAIHDLLAPL